MLWVIYCGSFQNMVTLFLDHYSNSAEPIYQKKIDIYTNRHEKRLTMLMLPINQHSQWALWVLINREAMNTNNWRSSPTTFAPFIGKIFVLMHCHRVPRWCRHQQNRLAMKRVYSTTVKLSKSSLRVFVQWIFVFELFCSSRSFFIIDIKITTFKYSQLKLTIGIRRSSITISFWKCSTGFGIRFLKNQNKKRMNVENAILSFSWLASVYNSVEFSWKKESFRVRLYSFSKYKLYR